MCREAFRDRFFLIPFARASVANCSTSGTSPLSWGRSIYSLKAEEEDREEGQKASLEAPTPLAAAPAASAVVLKSELCRSAVLRISWES